MNRMIALAAFLLAGCTLAALFPASHWHVEHESSPCTPMPMPTGEQYYPAEFHLPPPSSVWAGQSVRIEFSGGVLVTATAQQCGDRLSVLAPNQATAEATIRQVQVKLNDQVIHTQSCGYRCVLEFYIPANIMPGMYEWELFGLWETTTFPVQVQALQLTC